MKSIIKVVLIFIPLVFAFSCSESEDPSPQIEDLKNETEYGVIPMVKKTKQVFQIPIVVMWKALSNQKKGIRSCHLFFYSLNNFCTF